jgi:UDP-N-acetylenolpyruvoylglucosamine reductase
MFFAPRDASDLAAFLRQLPAHMPLLWLGLGSNLLVRDGGFPRRGDLTRTARSRLLERISATRSTPKPAFPARASRASA